ncbi:MAG TPA: glycosyltransferase family 4 protein, partial [Planctomycetota bacterium]|nr:glycosyltransferase family 4 protein [Planctomycetota bacterium]
MEAERQRILFLHPSSELYGSDRTLLDLAVGLNPSKFEVRVAVPAPGPLCEALEARGIPVHCGPLGVAAMGSLSLRGLARLAWQMPKAIAFVRQLVRTFQPHIVHTNTMVVLGGALGAASSRALHVWHIHEIPIQPKWLAPLTARLLQRLADQVVWNSHATANTFLRHHRTLRHKATVIHNGIDRERLLPLPSQAEARRELGWPQDVPIAMVLGRINAWKGQTLAIEATGQLTQLHPDLYLAIVGGTPPGQLHFEHELNQAVYQAEMGQRLLRHDFDGDVQRFYAACDFVLVPSTRPEPFGLVILEAFCAGKPVIASAHGGPMEIVQPGQTGAWFEPNNARALALCMHHFLEHPEATRAMGQRALRQQERHFSLRSYLRRFARLYRRLPEGALGEDRSSAVPLAPEIVHVNLGKANPRRMNGVNRVVHGLAKSQQRTGPVEVWGLCHEPDAPTPPRNYGLRTFPRYQRRSKLAPGLLGELDSMAKWPRSERPVFHLHGSFLPEMASLAKALHRRGLEFVFTPHGAYVPGALHKHRLLKTLYARCIESRWVRHAKAMQALSEEEREALQHWFPGVPVVCIAPGQDPANHPKAATTHAGRSLRLGSLGRLDSHTKGLDLLLEGLARFVQGGGAAHWTLAGDGPDRQALQGQVERLGLSKHVTFAGEIYGAQKQEFFQELDLYVQVSRHEGLPGAPLEA